MLPFLQGVDIVVAAPGRAREHLTAGTLRLDACIAVVLDEADLLLSEILSDFTSSLCWCALLAVQKFRNLAPLAQATRRSLRSRWVPCRLRRRRPRASCW